MKASLKRLIVILPATIALLAPTLALGSVHALDSSVSNSSASSSESTRLANTKTKGDAEITRRLATLNTLSAKITAASKLTAANKATLTKEVTDEISNLTALKTKLDGETTAAGAASDVQSMVSDYRVYALVVPKVQLVRMADNQQIVETKLSALATKLQTRITVAKNAGKDVSGLQTKLDDMKTQITSAQTVSSALETKVIALQPTDYNSDHSIIAGAAAQLKTAHDQNVAAYNDAKSIAASLKAL